MTWETLEIEPPQALTTISDNLGTVVEALTTLIEFSKAQAEIAKLISAGANVQFALIEAAIDGLIAEINALRFSGIAGIIAHPYAEGVKAKYSKYSDTMMLKPKDAISQIKEAFDDPGDQYRPTGLTNFGGIIIVGSCAGIEDFFIILEKLGLFFNLQKLLKLRDKIMKRFQNKDQEVSIYLPTGLDFYGIRQDSLLPSLDSLLDLMVNKLEGIKNAIISSSKAFDDIIAFAVAQLAEFEEIITELINAIETLRFDLSGQNVVYQVFPQDTNTIETILAGMSSDQPSHWNDQNYTVAFGLFGSTEGLTTMLSVLGL
jgi:hypothetical protein